MEQSTKEISRNIKNKIIPFVKGVIAFLLVTLSLFHVFFNNTTQEIQEQKKSYKSLVKKRDSFFENNLIKFKEGKLSKDEYIESTSEAMVYYKSSLKDILNTKNAYAANYSFRGRSSFHFWIFVFGLVTALFFFSCKSLHDDISRGSNFRLQLVSLSGVLVSCFWFIHLVFLTQKDFQKHNYIGLILFCAALFSSFTYFLVKYYTYKDQKINNLSSFIIRVRKNYYPKIAVKAKISELNSSVTPSDNDGIDDYMDEFQKDYRELTEKL